MKYFLPPVTRSTQTTYPPTPSAAPQNPGPPCRILKLWGRRFRLPTLPTLNRNRTPNRTCLAGFFGIIHNNSFVFNKTIRKGRTNVSGFWPPPAPKRTHPGTSPATPRSSTSPAPPNPPTHPRAPLPCDSPAPRRSSQAPTPAGFAPPEDTPRPAPAPRPASPRLPESRSPPSACRAPEPCPPSPP